MSVHTQDSAALSFALGRSDKRRTPSAPWVVCNNTPATVLRRTDCNGEDGSGYGWIGTSSSSSSSSAATRTPRPTTGLVQVVSASPVLFDDPLAHLSGVVRREVSWLGYVRHSSPEPTAPGGSEKFGSRSTGLSNSTVRWCKCVGGGRDGVELILHGRGCQSLAPAPIL